MFGAEGFMVLSYKDSPGLHVAQTNLSPFTQDRRLRNWNKVRGTLLNYNLVYYPIKYYNILSLY